MKISDLIEISTWDTLPENRKDLLELAGLPGNFALRPLPEFPSVEEVRACIGWPNAQFSSGVTDHWKELHDDVKHYPKLVQQAILKAWGHRMNIVNDIWGYAWKDQVYLDYVQDIQQKHAVIQNILETD